VLEQVSCIKDLFVLEEKEVSLLNVKTDSFGKLASSIEEEEARKAYLKSRSYLNPRDI
jgi:hypothetical protein